MILVDLEHIGSYTLKELGFRTLGTGNWELYLDVFRGSSL